MQKYRRVALKDRIEIQAYLEVGLGLSEIAKVLGFHKSTVSREVKRSHGAGGIYKALSAHEGAKKRFGFCKRGYVIKEELLKFISEKLQKGWSPEQISGRLKHEGSQHQISHQSIYRFTKRFSVIRTCLRFGYKRRGFGRGKHRKWSRQSSWKTSIRERPEAANQRSELGHWERDLFFAANRKTVLILSDRKSRYVLLKKTSNFKSDQISRLTKQVLKESKIEARTITNDNGSEFFDVRSLKVPVYFCDVQKPQQRGTIENTIGLIRQYITRKTNLDELSLHKIKAIEKTINLRPRKILDYKTPYEIFNNKTVALAV